MPSSSPVISTFLNILVLAAKISHLSAGLYGGKWSHRWCNWWKCSSSICTWHGTYLRWSISGMSSLHIHRYLPYCWYWDTLMDFQILDLHRYHLLIFMWSLEANFLLFTSKIVLLFLEWEKIKIWIHFTICLSAENIKSSMVAFLICSSW